MAGKAVTSLTTGPENPRRRVDPRYARPAKRASLRATDDCGGCDRARLVYVGWGGISTAPTASPVEGWIAFDRMSGATNFKGEYLGTIIAGARRDRPTASTHPELLVMLTAGPFRQPG